MYNFFQVYQSGHGIIRMFFLHIQALVCIALYRQCVGLSGVSVQRILSVLLLVCACKPLAHVQYCHRPYDYSRDRGIWDSGCRKHTSLCSISERCADWVQTLWVNQAFKWLWLSLLALQFVLALGNRPKGEKMAYTVTFA